MTGLKTFYSSYDHIIAKDYASPFSANLTNGMVYYLTGTAVRITQVNVTVTVTDLPASFVLTLIMPNGSNCFTGGANSVRINGAYYQPIGSSLLNGTPSYIIQTLLIINKGGKTVDWVVLYNTQSF